ncbi:MAG: asparaginase [archaeon]|nr:asparaginase [archaeon]
MNSDSDLKKKKICLLFCGGTIAMARKSPDSPLEPTLNSDQLYSMVPKIKQFAEIQVKFVVNRDSSNMVADDWLKMINTIKENMNDFDAFILTHGTDTMAQTANAIAYAFGRTLKKPVIITGSQAEPWALGTDATVNIERAFRTALSTTIPEVMISFHDLVLRGTRTRKSSEKKLAAFHSPAINPLAEHFGSSMHWNINPNPTIEQNTSEKFLPYFSQRVITVSLESGQDAQYVNESLLARSQERIAGIIWVSLGAGNVPEIHHTTIKRAKELGIPIVVTSQFPGGKLNMNEYKAGSDALKLGVIPAEDMTPEAASTKLKWTLGVAEKMISQNKLKKEDIIEFAKKVFSHNRAEEVTLNNSVELNLEID